MAMKEVYLLTKASLYELEKLPGSYDDECCMNIIKLDDERVPLVTVEMGGPTQSKTMAAPGDDDPDPEDERCY